MKRARCRHEQRLLVAHVSAGQRDARASCWWCETCGALGWATAQGEATWTLPGALAAPAKRAL